MANVDSFQFARPDDHAHTPVRVVSGEVFIKLPGVGQNTPDFDPGYSAPTDHHIETVSHLLFHDDLLA